MATDKVNPQPDVASAQAAAAASGSPVEVTSLDDEYSTTYANPDGTLTTDTSQTPLRIQQGGTWVDVDYTLQHVNGGWSPVASPFDVVFSDGGDQDAATFGNGAKELDLSWDVTLPTPTINGAQASYDLGNGETLELLATSSGYEQSLVLAQPPTSLPRLRLPFDTGNLTMSTDGAGGYVFSDAAGNAVYSVPRR
jgi:hypothetical protein